MGSFDKHGFLLGGLVVEDQYNGIHEVFDPSPSDFYGVGPNRKSIDKTKNN